MNNTELRALFAGIAKGSAATCVAALVVLALLTTLNKAAH